MLDEIVYLITHFCDTKTKCTLKTVSKQFSDNTFWTCLELQDKFNWSCQTGQYEIVEQLLNGGRIDPSTDDNLPIMLASKYGHVSIVDKLLQDERVSPIIELNKYNKDALALAITHGNIDVVKRLLQDARIKSTNYIHFASRKGEFEIAYILQHHEITSPDNILDFIEYSIIKLFQITLIKFYRLFK